MCGPDGREVSVVEARDLWLAKSFSQGNDAGVNHAEWQVRVLLLEALVALEIRDGWSLGAVDALEHVSRNTIHAAPVSRSWHQ